MTPTHAPTPGPAPDRVLAPPGWAATLRPREYEVARLLVRGHSRAQVARALDVSENAVRNYTQRLFLVLGVHSVPQLAARYWRACLPPAQAPSRWRPPDWYDALTPRERQVCDPLVTHGLAQAEAARALGISPHTYKHHLDSIMLKARAYSMVHVICLYYGGDPCDRRPAPPPPGDGGACGIEQVPIWRGHMGHVRHVPRARPL